MSDVVERGIFLGAGSALTIAGVLLDEPHVPKWQTGRLQNRQGDTPEEKRWQNVSDVVAYSLNSAAVGYYTSQTIRDHDRYLPKSAGLLSTYLWTFGSVEVLKKLTGRQRPDRSDNLSFPSGHTALSFAAATYVGIDLIDTFGRKYPEFIFPSVILGYGLAALVGGSRIAGKKHYWEDVVAGALLGIALGGVNYLVFNSRSQEVSPDRKTIVFNLGSQF